MEKVPSDKGIVELAKLAEDAREQADLYRAGVLAGVGPAGARGLLALAQRVELGHPGDDFGLHRLVELG